MLRMQNLSKVYRTHMIETHALRGFDIHVKEGEFVAVTGPSGSGKTTFRTSPACSRNSPAASTGWTGWTCAA